MDKFKKTYLKYIFFDLLLIFLLSLTVFGQFEGIRIWNQGTFYVHEIALFVMAIFLIPKIVKNKEFLVKTALSYPALIFSVISLSLLIINYFRLGNVSLINGLLYTFRWLLYFLLYLYVLRFKINVRLISIWMYLAPVLISVVGLMQLVFYKDLRNLSYLGWDPHYGRLFSTILDPNFTGLLMLIGFLLGLSLFGVLPRMILISTQTILLISIILTYSRSTYLAFLASVFVYLILKRNLKIIYLIVFFIIIYLILPKTPLDVINLLRPESTMARVNNYRQSINQFLASPVIGWGFGITNLGNIKNAENGFFNRAGSGIDNSLMFVAASTGIIGFFSYLYLIFKQFVLAFKVQSGNKTLADTYILILTAVLVHGMFNNSMFYVFVMVFIWLMSALTEKSMSS